jgi:hypothetical protein
VTLAENKSNWGDIADMTARSSCIKIFTQLLRSDMATGNSAKEKIFNFFSKFKILHLNGRELGLIFCFIPISQTSGHLR